MAISATFTSEPVEESLHFWGRELESPLHAAFAPYNQVFQQLLDPSSLLADKANGLNVLLVCFEDWLRDENNLLARLDDAKRALLPRDAAARHLLPNHLEIAHINRYETEYLYQEIFVDQCYLRHGIRLHDGDVVIDIGANIGMFSLFVLQQCRDAKVYAFEPSPTFKALDTNMKIYGDGQVQAFQLGILDRTKEAAFTFYEKSSVFSSFNANSPEDEQAVRAVVANMLSHNEAAEAADLDRYVDELMTDRMASQSFICQLKSLSDIIREHDIDHIDLLKVDAEKSEVQILEGIEDQDWPKIGQMVLEVHDRQGDVIRDVMALLGSKGFTLSMEEETLLERSGLYNIFATRAGERKEASDQVSLATARQARVQENVSHLVTGLKAAAERSPVPHIVMVCPGCPDNTGACWFLRSDGNRDAGRA